MIRDATGADAAAIARVHVDSWRTTYRGLMPDAVLDGLSYAGRERQWVWATSAAAEGRGCVVVADEGEAGIVGFASGGACRDDLGYGAEVPAIYLLEAWQGRGLGKGLMLAAADRLAARGYDSLLVWVLETNELGRRFYAALGGAVVGAKEEELFGATLREVAYGWPDLAALRARAGRR